MTSELVEIVYSTGTREHVSRAHLYYNWAYCSWVYLAEDGKRYWVKPAVGVMLDPLRKR